MNVTLYTVIGNTGRVREAALKHFSDVLRCVDEADDGGDGKNAYRLHFMDDTVLEFTVRHDPDFMRGHTAGMHGFFALAPLANEELKQSVLRQIDVFNCVVGATFETDEDERRTSYIVNALFAVAGDLHALVLFPSMELYTADGKLLLSMQGESELKSYTPVGNADFLDGAAEESAADEARRARSLAFLQEKGIPCLPSLRAAVLEADAAVRSEAEIARRLYALFAVCVYSEALSSGETREEAQKYLRAVDAKLSGELADCLTDEEMAYLRADSPPENAVVKFGWRYEGCLVLLWALHGLEELPYPDAICDVSSMAAKLWAPADLTEFLAGCERRAAGEVLDAADLILRLDWACTEARIHGQPAPADLHGGVVYERHYALNWLVGASQNAGWDDISTDT